MPRGRRGDGDDAVRRDVDVLLGNHRSDDPPPVEELAEGCVRLILGMVLLAFGDAVENQVRTHLQGLGLSGFWTSVLSWVIAGGPALLILAAGDRLLPPVRRRLRPR